MESKMECLPLTLDCWGDFEELFGRNVACGGCALAPRETLEAAGFTEVARRSPSCPIMRFGCGREDR